jgi:hypothetical protein
LTCNNCNRSGLFLRLDSLGLCENCSHFVTMDINNLARIYNDCVNLLENSFNLKVLLGRLETIDDVLQKLIKYENKKIYVLSESPAKLFENLQNSRKKDIQNFVSRNYSDVSYKISKLKTNKSKFSNWEKYISEINSLSTKINNPEITKIYLKLANKELDKLNSTQKT